MPSLTLDDRTLLTIRNALWFVQQSAAAADAAITAQLVPPPAVVVPLKPPEAAKPATPAA